MILVNPGAVTIPTSSKPTKFQATVNPNPLAGIVFDLQLQSSNGGAPIGLYEDTAATDPALVQGNAIEAYKDELSGSGIKLTQDGVGQIPTLDIVSGARQVKFEGGQGLHVASSAALQLSGQTFTWIIEVRPAALSGVQRLVNKEGNYNTNLEGVWAGFDFNGAGGFVVLGDTLSTGTNYTYFVWFDSALKINSGQINTGGIAGKYYDDSWTPGSNDLYLGIHQSGLQGLSGNIEDVYLTNALLSPAQRAYLAGGGSTALEKRGVCDGNSLTFGFGVIGPTYPAQLAASLGSGWWSINAGVNGQTTASMITLYPTKVAPIYDAARPLNWLVAWEICNSLSQNLAMTGVEAGELMQDYCDLAQATGFKVVVVTALQQVEGGGVPAGLNARIDAANVWVRANWASFADALFDAALIPQLSDPSDTTYFQADGVHLNGVGDAVFVAGLEPIVEGLT